MKPTKTEIQTLTYLQKQERVMKERLKYLEDKHINKIRLITETIGKELENIPEREQAEICAIIVFHTLNCFETKEERKEVCTRLNTLIDLN